MWGCCSERPAVALCVGPKLRCLKAFFASQQGRHSGRPLQTESICSFRETPRLLRQGLGPQWTPVLQAAWAEIFEESVKLMNPMKKVLTLILLLINVSALAQSQRWPGWLDAITFLPPQSMSWKCGRLRLSTRG